MLNETKISEFSVDEHRGDMVNYETMKSKHQELNGRVGFIVTDHKSINAILKNFLLIRFDGHNLQYLVDRNRGEFWEYLPKVDGWRFVPKNCIRNDVESFIHAGQYLYGFEKSPERSKGVKTILDLIKMEPKVLVDTYLRKPK